MRRISQTVKRMSLFGTTSLSGQIISSSNRAEQVTDHRNSLAKVTSKEGMSKNRKSFSVDQYLAIAQPVDAEALEAEIKDRAKESILMKLKAEAPEATEVTVIPNNDTQQNDFERQKKRKEKRLKRTVTTALAVITCIGIGLAIGLAQRHGVTRYSESSSNSTSASYNSDCSSMAGPTDISSSIVQEDIIFLQELFQSISGDVVLDTSSPQSRTIEWLATIDQYYNRQSIQTVNPSNLNDRYVLALLYFATNGPSWVKSQGYLANTSICNWQFITCDSTESVTEVNIPNNNMVGPFPPELGALTSLEVINFAGDHLYGTIPTTIGQLTRLEILELYFNSLSGPIPSEIGTLRNLEKLLLDANSLSGTIPSTITMVPKLETFNVAYNSLSGTVPDFGCANTTSTTTASSSLSLFRRNQTKLKSIMMWNNFLTGTIPTCITRLSGLETINWSYNMFTGSIPSNIGTLEKLIELDWSHNSLEGPIPESIGALEFVSTIYLEWNSLQGTLPTELGTLTELSSIRVANNDLSGQLPSEFGRLRRLETVWLDGNRITGSIPLSWSNIPNLATLRLSNTSLWGSFDDALCFNNTGTTNNELMIHLEADCGGTNPEVNCSCCTKCCNDESGECEENVPQLCENFANRYSNLLGSPVGCDCTLDETSPDLLLAVNCQYIEDCPTCNEQLTICGTSTNFGFPEISNYSSNLRKWKTDFSYRKSPDNRTDTLTWEYDNVSWICGIQVNGQECRRCALTYCLNGYLGLHIDCTNIVEGPTGLYDSCFRSDEGGIFDVFSWMETESWIGCPFFTNLFD